MIDIIIRHTLFLDAFAVHCKLAVHDHHDGQLVVVAGHAEADRDVAHLAEAEEVGNLAEVEEVGSLAVPIAAEVHVAVAELLVVA